MKQYEICYGCIPSKGLQSNFEKPARTGREHRTSSVSQELKNIHLTIAIFS